MARLTKAARVYGRPLAVFFLEDIPRDFAVITDFRKLSGDQSREVYSYELTLLIRDIQACQEWAAEVLQELGYPRLKFVGSADLNTPTSRVAEQIRKTLGVSVDEQLSWDSLNTALNKWMERVESARVFVALTSARGKVLVRDARGFAIVDAYAPFIFLNSKDSLGGRIFTLAHELAHVWIGASGVSGFDLLGDDQGDAERTESFCNQVASQVVFPESAYSKLVPHRLSQSSLDEDIARLARTLSISRDVVARRFLDKGLINKRQYAQLHDQYVREWTQAGASPRSGGDYYVNHVRSMSKGFVRLVGDAYSRERITGSEAAGLLRAKLNNFGRLMQAAHVGAID